MAKSDKINLAREKEEKFTNIAFCAQNITVIIFAS